MFLVSEPTLSEDEADGDEDSGDDEEEMPKEEAGSSKKAVRFSDAVISNDPACVAFYLLSCGIIFSN